MLIGRRREPLEALVRQIEAAGRHRLAAPGRRQQLRRRRRRRGRRARALGAHRRARQQRGHRRGEAVPRDRGRELGRDSGHEPPRRVPDGAARRPRAGRGGGGSIVHIASIDASGGDGPYASYNASKAGLLGLNRTMALELGPHGVRVNCVSPGFTHTEMTEVGVPPGMMDYLVRPLRPRPAAPARAPGRRSRRRARSSPPTTRRRSRASTSPSTAA